MQSGRPVTLNRWLHEPLLHFIVLAGVVFGLYGISRDDDAYLIEVEQSEIEARIFLQELTSGEAASPAIREAITSLYLEEQMLVREAISMELDNDARIHDMLAQKMRHVLSGDVIQPGDDELRVFYESNLDAYTTLPTVTSDELVFSSRDPLADDVANLLRSGAEPEAMLALAEGSVSPLPRANPVDLRNIFSQDFADQVFNAVPGTWVGPYVSNRGQHWLRVTAQQPASTPSLEEISDRVRLDWIAAEEDARLQQEIDQLWQKYSVRIVDDSAAH